MAAVPTHIYFFKESDKLLELSSATFEMISASSSEADFDAETTDTQRLELLKRTQLELDQIYSTTESIMSSSCSRLSKSLSRDSQQMLLLASTEPVLRNSVMISIDDEEQYSTPMSAEKTSSSEDSSCHEEHNNTTAEDSSTSSSSSPEYSEVKLRSDKSREQRHQRPLTRYMPVTQDNFDLKGHIESAGHQIDVCNQVKLTSTYCKGHLQKLTIGKLRNSWNRRWFVFDRSTRKLSYYSKDETNTGTHIPFRVSLFFGYFRHSSTTF